jgi:hypothetical protein
MSDLLTVSWWETVTFWQMVIVPTLYHTNSLSCIFSAISPKQQSESRHVAPLGHIMIWANWSLFLLHIAASVHERQQLSICIIWFDPGSNHPSTALEALQLHLQVGYFRQLNSDWRFKILQWNREHFKKEKK